MEWFVKSASLSAAVIICVYITVTTALPFATEQNKNEFDTSLVLETCRSCFIEVDDYSCFLCDLALKEADNDDVASVEKRSRMYNPLLRGGYPKKSTYYPYYNPLNRGSYFKKSYSPPVYHPFLRGGYRAPTVQRNYWNKPRVEDQLP